MKNSIYTCFQHWVTKDGKNNAVWIYSDPHFSDEEMIHLRSNYISDEEQVKSINKKVGKNDTIIFLGDIGNVEFIKKIRGYKVLILGNHDAGAEKYKRQVTILEQEYFNPYCSIIKKADDNRLFDEVYEGTLQIGPKLMLSHEPVNYPYCLNIHGHDHSNWQYRDEAHLNVCAEHINYTPLSLKDIIHSGRLKNIPDIHRETIDGATERKQKRKNNK